MLTYLLYHSGVKSYTILCGQNVKSTPEYCDHSTESLYYIAAGFVLYGLIIDSIQLVKALPHIKTAL